MGWSASASGRAAAFALTAAAAACEPAAPQVALPGLALDRPAAPPVEAGVAPGRCPQDAPWNGKVCMGMGYVACPGERRLDEGGVCAASAHDVGADR
jgi:hypothetical protein